ncbi:MAG: RIP metalloprotease RseP [Rubrobacter sp.]|nr:RIP metalloprotease RseP [Rubrobacter sp.]
MTIISAVVGLSALVVIHELGHMLAAKTVGVKVTEFGFGFGPPLLRKKIGKTTYSIRIILLGGFVKMAGMNDEEKGPESYRSKGAWRRAFIILAGPFANLLAAVLILATLYVSGVPTGVTTEVEDVIPGSLAAEAGMQGGDRIVAVDGEEVESWRQFQEIMRKKQPGDKVELVVERNEERDRFSGMLTADPEDSEKAIVGVRPIVITTSYGPLEALGLGVERTIEIIGIFGTFIGQLVTGEVSFYDSVSSPIGIVEVSSDVASQGVQSFAQLLALISINLAIFNLLPILPLDGGHLFFIAGEKILGRPVSAETVGKFAAFGLALILMMFVLATYADLSKIFTGQPFIPEVGP